MKPRSEITNTVPIPMERNEQIIAVNIRDGDGSGAGTKIDQESGAVLQIWTDTITKEIPLRMAAQAPELLNALKEIIPAQDDADDCAAARENELLTNDRCDPKTSEYFRVAKIRLMKAREAARSAIEKAENTASVPNVTEANPPPQ